MENKVNNTKQKIINVSLRFFAEEGLSGVSVRTIAKEAEVNIAAVNYHFGSKADLYFEVIKYVFTECGQDMPDEFDQRVDNAVTQQELQDLLVSLVDVKVRAFLEENDETERLKRLLMLRVFLNDELAGKMMDEFREEHELQVKLFRKINPDLSEVQAQMAVFSMIGQLAFYIFGRIMIYSAMNITQYSTQFKIELKQIIISNLSTLLKLNDCNNEV